MRLDDREWKPFYIEDIFHIFPGKRLEKRNMISGNTPFIGASDSNNGVTEFIGNVNESLDSHVLGINYNGSVCETFYHEYECVFSDDVKRLHLKCIADSKFIYLFIGTAIKQQKSKYQYAYKFNEQRMRRQLIMLPVDEIGAPDYAFMEAYVRELMTRKLEQYRAYIQTRLAELVKNRQSAGGGQFRDLAKMSGNRFVWRLLERLNREKIYTPKRGSKV